MNAFKEGFEKSRHSVCYNGDIFRRKDYDRLVKEYPDLDKIMMGRGIMMNPFLMEEIADGTSQKVSGKCLPPGRQTGWRSSTVCSVTDIPML